MSLMRLKKVMELRLRFLPLSGEMQKRYTLKKYPQRKKKYLSVLKKFLIFKMELVKRIFILKKNGLKNLKTIGNQVKKTLIKNLKTF